jgi:hypothetical protein
MLYVTRLPDKAVGASHKSRKGFFQPFLDHESKPHAATTEHASRSPIWRLIPFCTEVIQGLFPDILHHFRFAGLPSLEGLRSFFQFSLLPHGLEFSINIEERQCGILPDCCRASSIVLADASSNILPPPFIQNAPFGWAAYLIRLIVFGETL